MKKVILGLVVALTVVALLAAPAMAAGKSGLKGNSNVGHVYLYEKVPSGDWPIVEDGAWGKFNYKLTGEYEATMVSGVFNGKELEVGANYTLIYYIEPADDPWEEIGTTGIYGTEVVVLGTGTVNDEGNVHIAGTAEIGEPDEQPVTGDYVDQMGDKIWLVKTDDITTIDDTTYITGWNPNEYLFESALINTP
ncbi:hypothetical protein ACFLXY_07395 [Chloroflexota bacterium]